MKITKTWKCLGCGIIEEEVVENFDMLYPEIFDEILFNGDPKIHICCFSPEYVKKYGIMNLVSIDIEK